MARTSASIALAVAAALPACSSPVGGSGGELTSPTTAAASADVATNEDAAADSAPDGSFRADRIRRTVWALTYADVGGQERRILVELRRPARRDGLVPVVVWSHGGSSGKRSTAKVGTEWSETLTGAGYAFVAVAHPGRDASSRQTLCGALGIEDCSRFKYLDWDRPHDVAVVFDWLESVVEQGLPLDLDRLVYGGHSAGARSVLITAGLEWSTAPDRLVPSDDRPAAFLVASPPGAESQGWIPEQFAAIDRPLLVLTGAGDTTSGSAGPDRRATFGLLPPGPFAIAWVEDDEARHTAFNLETAGCVRSGGTDVRCEEITRTLGRLGVAFLSEALDAEPDIARFAALAADRISAGIEVATAIGRH